MKIRSHSDFDKLVGEIGKLYLEFVAFTKSEFSAVAPNDHLIGPIGEWRAIQVIHKTLGLKAARVSSSAKDPDDLLVEYGRRRHYVSVKTTTEHSKTGLSGIFHTDKGRWKWCICMRLEKDLSYKSHFWISKKDASKLFRTKAGKPKQFKWSSAFKAARKSEIPIWFK